LYFYTLHKHLKMKARLACLIAGIPFLAAGQISNLSVSTTATQAILRYTSPVSTGCLLKVADMDRRIRVASATQSTGRVTVTTVAPHGLLPHTTIFVEQLSVTAWNGWQKISAVPNPTSFTFPSPASGVSMNGNIGVLIDDVNPALFANANRDSRPGNIFTATNRVFVIGKRTADVAADGNRYSRALQVNSRHHFTLTCGTQSLDQEYTTRNLLPGDTHNDGLPVDRTRPGEYAYPTIRWDNAAQALIDPMTGLRSFRGTRPSGTPSTIQKFQAAFDPSSMWTNASGPLAGGVASFNGPCIQQTCALFLRADNLPLKGGATYTSGYGEGTSLDWVTVNVSEASISGSCSGDDCKIAACLTVNGVTCASGEREVALTSTPASYTFGTQTPMDLWQASGAPAVTRPDAARASGTVNYNRLTRQVTWAGGNKFNFKWTAGSRIVVNGKEYVIAAVQNELQLTLAAGPAGDLKGVPYSASNFGVLIRKKTAGSGRVTIGYTTFQYGSTGMPSWPSLAVNNCSSAVVRVGGVDGYNCFVDTELYWISADGSDFRDLGAVGMSYWPDGRWSAGAVCGQGSKVSQFDPLDGNTWYCLLPTFPFDPLRKATSIVKAQYQGAHQPNTPGAKLPDCGLNGGVKPCIAFTLMQPNKRDAISEAGPAFSRSYSASGYQAAYWIWGGISDDGDVMVYTREAGGQDTKGWMFLFTLGDRTPARTGSNSIRPIAAASSYSKAPLSWCYVHGGGVPEEGWAVFACNDFSYRGSAATYVMTLTSAALNTSVGVPGGLNGCPSNPLGVSGKNCTDITVNGEPRQMADGSFLQPTQVGDLIRMDNEYLRIVAKRSPTSLTVQRGYVGKVAAHAGVILTMSCGVLNSRGAKVGVWNYRMDPQGANSMRKTILADSTVNGGHGGRGSGIHINAGTGSWQIGEALCPSSILTPGGVCYMIRRGSWGTVVSSPLQTAAHNPPFAGKLGIGVPNQVDSHPGPCLNSSCFDARPMNGGLTGIGSAAAPFFNVGGQLWRGSGGQTLNRKFLTTMAYAGRFPLVDISGPGSLIGLDSVDSYKYCIAMAANECHPGAAAGDVYVNAPFISTPYCSYPGMAVQGDDTNPICIGDLGAYTGNLAQIGVSTQDIYGTYSRRLGPAYSRWNQHAVYWNSQSPPNGRLLFSQVRWLDGVRHENIITILPPLPQPDGVARGTFVPVRVPIPPPPGPAAKSAVVEFGYLENGGPRTFFCTSRQENCVATQDAIDPANPFAFAQTENYSGTIYAPGAAITIPALSQRILYYRFRYLGLSGQTVAIGATQIAAVP
jgi:hypothetical protein